MLSKLDISNLISGALGSLIVLLATFLMQADQRQKDSLEKEIVYAERMSADLTNEFAKLTLRVAETRGIPQVDKMTALDKMSELYQAVGRVESRITVVPVELQEYKSALNQLRSTMVSADNFMEFKPVLEAMGSVKEAEIRAFSWLATEAAIKRSS